MAGDPEMMDQFLNACWGAEPLRVEVSDDPDAPPRVVEFARPNVLIGRSAGTDLCLADPLAAPRHLYLQLIAGRVFGVHLSEETPTLLGHRLWQSGWVKATDEFLLGGSRVRVVNPDHRPPGWPEPTQNPLLPDEPAAGGYSLIPLAQRATRMRPGVCHRRLLLIGRSVPAKFLIRHRSLNPVHAAVVRTNGDLWLVNLCGEPRVLVNGEAVSEVKLRSGDHIRVGSIDLALHVGDSPPHAVEVVPPVAPTWAAPPAVADPNLQLILEHMSRMQQQTFEQIHQMMATMATAMQRPAVPPPQQPPALAAPFVPLTIPAAEPPPAPKPAPPVTPMTEDQANLHAWVEHQLGQLENDQRSTIGRLLDRLAGR